MIMYKIGRSLSGGGHWPGAGISTVNLHVRNGRAFGFLRNGLLLSGLNKSAQYNQPACFEAIPNGHTAHKNFPLIHA